MLITKLVLRNLPLGEEKKWEQFLACAKRTETIFDMAKAVLPMKSSSPGCTMVTIKSKTLLYMTTPEWPVLTMLYLDFFLSNIYRYVVRFKLEWFSAKANGFQLKFEIGKTTKFLEFGCPHIEWFGITIQATFVIWDTPLCHYVWKTICHFAAVHY